MSRAVVMGSLTGKPLPSLRLSLGRAGGPLPVCFLLVSGAELEQDQHLEPHN